MAFPGVFTGTVQSAGKIAADDGLVIDVKPNSCTDGKILKVGDKVQFDLVDDEAGNSQAGNISGGTGTVGGKGAAPAWGAAGGSWGAAAPSWGGGKGGKDAGWGGGKGGKDGGKGGKDAGKDGAPAGVRRSGKKMKMCTHFEQGTCHKAMCTFAHSQAEIGTFYDLASGVVATGKMQGTVTKFEPDKGFGFLQSSDGQSYFFHQKQFVDGTSPVIGDVLAHDLEPSPLKPGQFQGSNITGGNGPFLGIKDKGKGKGKGKDGGKGKGKGKDGGKGKPFGGIVLPGQKGKDGGKGGGKDDGKGAPRLTGKKHQMCTHFPLGTCRKMDMCTFAHSEAEIGSSYDHSGGAGGGGSWGAAPKGGGKGAAGPYKISW